MPLSIRTFGSLEVYLGEEPLRLPASRKTRALLAFLVLAGGPQRRSRLCDIFWDVPDDPRGALRWSLFKLREIVNAGGLTRLLTDRERVQINPEQIVVDFHELRTSAHDDSASTSLADAWELSNQVLLEDCELPNQPHFTDWLRHQRNESARLRIQLSRRLALLPDLPAEDADKWAQRWLQAAPRDPQAAQQAVMAKRRLGREQEACALASDLEYRFREAGIAPLILTGGPAVRIEASSSAAADEAQSLAPGHAVRFVQASDGAALAWNRVGASSNPPLVKAGHWLTHMERDWGAPIWSPIFRDLARTFQVVRYDERGCGLSDWEVPEISFETFVSDLETVVDAAGLERFPLLGIGHGASVSIEYAARHPERVSHLILFGAYAAGWRHIATPEECREHEAITVLIEAGWGRDDPSYRNLFSASFMPDANDEELRWFDDFQRHAVSPRNAVRFLEALSRIDVRDRLQDVRAPTLVLHSQGDARVAVATARELATRIPNAEFLSLDSNNHMLLGRERASSDFLEHVRRFLLREGNGSRISNDVSTPA